MGTGLKRAACAVLLILAAGAGGAACAAGPGSSARSAAEPRSSGTAAAYGATDVMYLQMSLEYLRQGDLVVTPAVRRAIDPDVRVLATELRDQWRAEAETMAGWLTDWRQPTTADPGAGAHAGHGDVHSLRESDIAELTAATGTDFDRTAVSMLLGHLHNCVAVARLEATGGSYPPAKRLAESVTTVRQAQIQRLLALAATG